MKSIITKSIIISIYLLVSSCKTSNELYLIKQAGNWGYINSKGEVKISPTFDECCFERQEDTCCSRIIWPQSIGIVKQKGLYGAIDINGNFLIEPKFDFLDHYHNSYIIAQSANKFGVLNFYGDTLFPFIFDNQLINCNAKTGCGLIDDKYYLLNFEKRTKTETDYDKISYFSEGYATVKKDDLYGFINSEGQLVTKIEYQEAWPFRNGLAAVKQYYKWGFIDTTGSFILKNRYDLTTGFDLFTGKYAIVVENNKYGVIDREGRQIIPFKYEYLFFEAKNRLYASIISDDKTKSGIINLNQKWIFGPTEVPFEYFGKYVKINNAGKLGLWKRRNLKTILPQIFEDIVYRANGLTMFVYYDKVKKKELFGYVDRRGKLVWAEEGFDYSFLQNN